MERSLSETQTDLAAASIDRKLKGAIRSTDHAVELLERVKHILDHIEEKRTSSCEGICPMCGKVCDQ